MGFLDGLGEGLSLPDLGRGGGIEGPSAPVLNGGENGDENIGTPSIDRRPLGALERGTGTALASQGNTDGISIQTIPLPSPQGLAGNPNFTHIGTLNVGDRYVSGGQNSPATVAARPAQPHPQDSLSVEIAAPLEADSSSAISPPQEESPAPPRLEESSTSSFSFFETSSGGSIDEEERKRRERERMAQLERALRASALASAPSASASRPPQVAPPVSSTPSPSRTSSRFILEAHDVHNMGGPSSRVQISDRNTGQVLRTVNLPQGNSRTVVDLPPGQYQFTAIAGERPSGNSSPDHFDNFRVEVFQSGASPNSGQGASNSAAAPSPR